MVYSKGTALFFLAIYLGIGGAVGAVIGFAFGLLSRGRFRFRHFLISTGLGILGSGLGILSLLLLPTDAKLNGLPAALFGAEPHWAGLVSLGGAAILSLAGCGAVLVRQDRAARA